MILVERGSLNLVSCCYLVRRLAKKGSVVGNSIQRLALGSANISSIPSHCKFPNIADTLMAQPSAIFKETHSIHK